MSLIQSHDPLNLGLQLRDGGVRELEQKGDFSEVLHCWFEDGGDMQYRMPVAFGAKSSWLGNADCSLMSTEN